MNATPGNGEEVTATEGEVGHSVWPMSERVSVETDPQADAVSAALQGFHQPHDESGLLPRHNGTWHDSLALTHCLCWGAAWRMLDYLLAHPDEFDALREATECPHHVWRVTRIKGRIRCAVCGFERFRRVGDDG